MKRRYAKYYPDYSMHIGPGYFDWITYDKQYYGERVVVLYEPENSDEWYQVSFCDHDLQGYITKRCLRFETLDNYIARNPKNVPEEFNKENL